MYGKDSFLLHNTQVNYTYAGYIEVPCTYVNNVFKPIVIFLDAFETLFVDEHNNGASWIPNPLPKVGTKLYFEEGSAFSSSSDILDS